jgi:ureidoglycolate hydrolase
MNIKVLNTDESMFSNFGSFVKLQDAKPTSEDNTYKFWSDIAHYYIEGQTEIGICTVYKQNENTIDGLEMHINTPEILIPIDAPFVLPLLLEGDDESKMKAFKVNVGEAVVIKNGIWHGACLPVDKESASYFVIFRLNTPHEDVAKKTISPVTIQL